MNSKQQFDFTSLHKAFDKSILSEFTYNEIKKALSNYMINVPKTFNDACDPRRVEELIKILSSGVAISAAHSYVLTNDYSRVQNIFDASTYIRTEVNSYIVGNSKLEYDYVNPDTEEEHHKTIFTEGGVCSDAENVKPPRLAQIFRTVAASICTTGQDIKKKGTDITGVPYTTNPAVSSLAASIIKMKGVEEDVMAAGLKAMMAEPNRTAIFKNLCEAMAPNVPTEIVVTKTDKVDPITNKVTTLQKKEKAPLISYKKGNEANWNRQYVEASMTPRNFVTLLDKHSTALSKKGQGKWACDSWTGVPLGSLRSILSHKITLDDSGVKPGDSIFVNSSNGVLIDFLRANYGHKVVGRGSKYPMLPDKDLIGRVFDYCYYPDVIKAPLSGDMAKARHVARANVEKHFDIAVHGQVIVYLSPLYFLFPEYEGVFFFGENLKYEKIPTITSVPKVVSTHKWEDLKGVVGAEKDPHSADTVWHPPYVKDSCSEIELFYVQEFRKKNEEKYKDLPEKLDESHVKLIMEDFRYNKEYSTMKKKVMAEIASCADDTIHGRLRLIRDFEEVLVTPASFERVKANVKIGIHSYKSLLLYCEAFPVESVRKAFSQCLAYSKHALRCNWKLVPIHSRVYTINRIVKRMVLGFADIGDCYEIIYSHGLFEELLNDKVPFFAYEHVEPAQLPDQAHEIEKEVEDDEDDGEEELAALNSMLG